MKNVTNVNFSRNFSQFCPLFTIIMKNSEYSMKVWCRYPGYEYKYRNVFYIRFLEIRISICFQVFGCSVSGFLGSILHHFSQKKSMINKFNRLNSIQIVFCILFFFSSTIWKCSNTQCSMYLPAVFLLFLLLFQYFQG